MKKMESIFFPTGGEGWWYTGEFNSIIHSMVHILLVEFGIFHYSIIGPDFHGVYLLFFLFFIYNDSRWVCHRISLNT